jgi:NAD/NADP transhydrogenase beta subunit
MNHIITGTYFLAVLLFIFGLKLLSSPTTARKGNLIAGVGMLLAILITFPLIYLQYNQDPLFTTKILVMVLMILLGSVIGWVSAKKVPLTDMPQMVALFNGMGGGAAGVIGYLEILRGHGEFSLKVLAALALIIGTVSFSGSIGAFLKLQGWIGDRPITFPGQQILNAILLLATLILAFLTLMDISYLNFSRF